MPSEQDIALVERFLEETQATFRLVLEFGDIRRREREALFVAIREFAERQRPQIISAYQHTPDDDLAAAGVVDKQLSAKVEIPSVTAELLRAESGTEGSPDVPRQATGPRTRTVRQWIRRAKVLVGTLAKLLPPVEALFELLDLLDSALDRRS